MRPPVSRRWLVPLAAASSLVAGVLLAPTQAAPADPDESAVGLSALEEPQDFFADVRSGKAALRGLGDRLPQAAAINGMDPGELRRILVGDETVRVDPDGRVHYVELVATDAERTAGRAADASVGGRGAQRSASTFGLHSKPDADLKIFLDFDGATITGTQWQSSYPTIPDPLVAPAWDPADDGAAFSAGEMDLIEQVWAILAEDYAPFDVDVTTEDPGTAGLVRSSAGDTTYGSHALISASDDAYDAICPTGCGGVAYVGVFDEIDSPFQPAWTFPQGVGDSAKNIAEATSHEVGHNLALSHDGTSSQAYYAGHGNWAPIMGVGYNKPVAQFSEGTYPDANNQEDDISIIDGYLGLRTDEAPSGVDGAIAPTSDMAYIGSRDDIDTYALRGCETGDVITASPVDLAPDLDIALTLTDGARVSTTNDPTSGNGDGVTATGMGASVTVPSDEDYTLSVDGVGTGSTITGYDDYGSLGAYTLDVVGCGGALPPGAPGAPQNLSVTPNADGTSVALSWTAPSDLGDGVDGYTVTVVGAGSADVGPATSFTPTGLEKGTTYLVRVNAYNGDGPGEMASDTTTTATTEPGAVADLTATYVAGDQEILMLWDPPTDDGGTRVTGYQIFFNGANLGTLGGTAAVISPVTTPGDTVGVRPVNDVGVGPLTTVDTFAVPDAPTGVTATPGDGSATVLWTAPADDGGGVSTYTVTASPGGATATTSGTSAKIAGLTNGTAYTFTVVSTNPAGDSPASVASAAVTPRTVADTPRNVTATPADASAVVSWNAPADDGGADITRYTVTASPGGATATTTGATRATVTGLRNGTSYRFSVVATNAAGDSVAATSGSVTPVGAPSRPTRVKAKLRKKGKRILVKWKAATANGSPVTKYLVKVSRGKNAVVRKGTRVMLKNKIKRGKHVIRVRAFNAAGRSSFSKKVVVRTR